MLFENDKNIQMKTEIKIKKNEFLLVKVTTK